MGSSRFGCLVFAAAVCVFFTQGWAAWPYSPFESNVICDLAGDQSGQEACTDGAGGSIIVWADMRGSDLDIYCQHVSRWGDLLWPDSGLAICTWGNDQLYPSIISDGAGGAIISWTDDRNGPGNYDIHAQHIDGDGNLSWSPGGIAVCTASGDQAYPGMVGDGEGGAIICWMDDRDPGTDIYGQRVDEGGSVLWTPQGIVICSTFMAQRQHVLVSDGEGGAIVAWLDDRDGVTTDIFAQHVDASGNLLWPVLGVPIRDAVMGNGSNLRLVRDCTGGAIAVWEDDRGGATDIFAQRVDRYGSLWWTPNGVAICSAAGDQESPGIASDGLAGAVIGWNDDRDLLGEDDIYVQRVTGLGTMLWAADGVPICAADSIQSFPVLVSDGAEGAVVAWYDDRTGSGDIYVQRVTGSGSQLWASGGVAICVLPVGPSYIQMVSDGAGGATIVWSDCRRTSMGSGIYAQMIERNGYLGYPSGTIAGAVDHPDDQGDQIILSWQASYIDTWPREEIDYYSVWRRYAGLGLLARSLDARSDPFEVGGIEDLGVYLGASGWIHVDDIDAMQLEEYGCIAPSFGDSTESGIIWTEYMVLAHSLALGDYWISSPRAGYSVDNLAPGAPVMLTADTTGFDVELRWLPSGYYDEDLAHYNIHRSDTSGFTPNLANRIATASDTLFTDVDPGIMTWYYRVVAEDVHGNRSDPSNEASATVGAGMPDPTDPVVFRFVGIHPNPFVSSTRISFDLPHDAVVRLAVYTPSGRIVTTLQSGTIGAGRHCLGWQACDSQGMALPSGIYFMRLQAGNDTARHKMVLLR